MQGPESNASQPPNPQSSAEEHLNHLLLAGTDAPWYQSFFRNIKEYFNPPKLPPLEVTSKPVPVKDIWGDYRYGKQAGAGSMLVHIGAVVLLFTVASSKPGQKVIKSAMTLVAPDLNAFIPDVKPKEDKMQGGGGGGDRSPTPATFGKAPRAAPRQFTPPMAVVNNPNPKLLMEPTLVMQADAKLPNVDAPMWGDPLSKFRGMPSNGTGSGGGIGSGSGGGIGPGRGPGYGPGEGGGIGGGVYRVGGGVSAPIAIYKIEPEYSEEARKAKFQGTVVLSIVIDETGVPRSFRVTRPLGLGLDEKAIEAVQKWRFRPAVKDGRPVAVQASVEVNFRLL